MPAPGVTRRRLPALLFPFLYFAPTLVGAQGLDGTPASRCGGPPLTAPLPATDNDARALVRFAPALRADTNDAYLARALGTLTSDRVRRAIDVEVRSRGLAAGPLPANAASAVAEGRVLGVRFVLVGTVSHENDTARVEWKLVDARSGAELGRGVLAARDGDAERLVASLTGTLTKAFGRTTASVPPREQLATGSVPAMRAFLRGMGDADGYDSDRLELARAAFREAIAADRQLLAAHYRLAETGLRELEWGPVAGAARDTIVREAQGALAMVLLRDPYDARALALLGQLHLAAREVALAGVIAATLEHRAPNDPTALLLRAAVLRANGSDMEALTLLRKNRPVVSRDADALLALADLERRAGTAADACRLLNQVLTIDPLNAPAFVWRGLVRSGLSERREGWADAEVASRLGRVDWGDLAGAWIDASVGDTVRARNRTAPWMKERALQQAGLLDLTLRALVMRSLGNVQQELRVTDRFACADPRRKRVVGDPLLARRVDAKCPARASVSLGPARNAHAG